MCPEGTASSRAWFCEGSCCGPNPAEHFSREVVSLISNGTPNGEFGAAHAPVVWV